MYIYVHGPGTRYTDRVVQWANRTQTLERVVSLHIFSDTATDHPTTIVAFMDDGAVVPERVTWSDLALPHSPEHMVELSIRRLRQRLKALDYA